MQEVIFRSMEPPEEVAVLLIFFNREETVFKMLEVLREVKPSILYLAADGPRPNVDGEYEKCMRLREQVLEAIDWDCDIYTKFEAENAGCGRGPYTAIDWFFSNETKGIILEDDCIPSISFFPFCSRLLERFEDHQQIGMITGTNRKGKWNKSSTDYFFSKHGINWGWATWKDRWEQYDFDMKLWEDPQVRKEIKKYTDPLVFNLLKKEFDKTVEGYDEERSVWDFQWHFSQLYHRQLTIVPERNLITNIGFGAEATHTQEIDECAFIEHYEMDFPIKHNEKFTVDTEYDKWATLAFKYSIPNRIKRKLNAFTQKLVSTINHSY